MHPSWWFCPDATISKNKTTTVLLYQLNASVLMLRSQCHFAESKEMVHNTILHAFASLVKLEKMNKHLVRRKFHNHWEEKMITTISMHKHYHQNATILMLCHNPKLLSQCYCLKTTVPKLSSWCYCLNAYIPTYHDPTMPTLPSQCHHLHATLMMLLSQCYHPNATITMLIY